MFTIFIFLVVSRQAGMGSAGLIKTITTGSCLIWYPKLKPPAGISIWLREESWWGVSPPGDKGDKQPLLGITSIKMKAA